MIINYIKHIIRNRYYDRFKPLLYKPKKNVHIKTLEHIEKFGGFQNYDIVPYLRKHKLSSDTLMFAQHSFDTERNKNTEFFELLQEMGFIKIIDNKLFAIHQGTKYPAKGDDCKLIIQLLPKGVDYISEYRRKRDDKYFKWITIILLSLSLFASLPKSCNDYNELKSKM